MLTLDKVQLLEDRIKKAVTLINRLREQKASLEEQVQVLKAHNDELKDFAESYSHDSELIEMGISKALSQLEGIDGLDEQIPAEDMSRLAELDEIDMAAGESGRMASSGQTEEDGQVLGYEDDEEDPLI